MKVLSDNIALFDMDGTLCDHDKALKRDMEKLKSPKEVLPKNLMDDANPKHLKERADMIRKQTGWWENLEPFKLGFDILKITKELNFQTYILTKGPSSKPTAWAEKVKWIRKHVPSAKVTITEDKSQVYGKILVDDYPEYIIGWLKNRPRGLVIMPAHPYNKDFTHPNIIRYDGKNKKQVIEAIKKVKTRGSRKPLSI